MNRWRRIKRFFLWLLPARKVTIPAESESTWSGPRPGVEGPRPLGGWSDLPYPDDAEALCESRFTVDGAVLTCMLMESDHPRHPHEAGHDDHVYRWGDPDGSYQVAGILGTPYENEDWRTVRRG